MDRKNAEEKLENYIFYTTMAGITTAAIFFAASANICRPPTSSHPKQDAKASQQQPAETAPKLAPQKPVP